MQLFNRCLDLFIGAVYFMLLAEGCQLLLCLFRLLLTFRNTLVKKLHEQGLRFLVHVCLHEEEVVNDRLRNHLRFFWIFPSCSNLDKIRSLSVFNIKVLFCECFRIWLLFLFKIHTIDNGLKHRT